MTPLPLIEGKRRTHARTRCARLPVMARSAYYYWFTDGAFPVGSRRTR